MYRRFASADRLPSNRSEASRSPYAKNYRTNLTQDQREQLSHRQNVSKLPRRELEDRYIALIDEHFALKKENAANNEKIKKMATKLLRLSAEGKSRGTPFPLQLSPNEHLEIQIIRLEAYNALLKDRLSVVIRKYSNCVQSGATSAIRRPASCSNLSIKRKMSEDEINLLEIPEPPPLLHSRIDGRSNFGSGNALGPSDRKQQMIVKTIYKSTSQFHQPNYSHSQSSTIFENDNVSNVPETAIGTSASTEEKSSLNDLKNTIQKLENEIIESKSNMDSMKRINVALEEKLTSEMVSKRITENVELIELRRTMVDCENELHELQQQYLILRNKAEAELDEEQKKINELTNIVQLEMSKNRSLSDELKALKNATEVIESMQDETRELHAENKMFSEKQKMPTAQRTKDLSAKDNCNLQQLAATNEELSNLLSEAKSTIFELQDDLKSLKTRIETLQQQNDNYACELEMLKSGNDTKIDVMQKSCSRKSQTDECSAPPIPLEPIVIINSAEKKSKSRKVKMNRGLSAKAKTESSLKKPPNVDLSSSVSQSEHDESSSESDDTFVVSKIPKHSQEKKQIDRNEHHQSKSLQRQHFAQQMIMEDGTASEMSSIDSDENYRMFQKKNKELQNSLLLLDANGVPMDFSQRLRLLERAAFYRPLINPTNASNYNEPNDGHYLACNCTGFECDRQNQRFYEEIRKAVETAKSILLQEIQQTGGGGGTDTSENQMKDSALEYSSECREFLRVQYNLNNLYKQELELMCQTCKNQTQQLLNEIDSLKTKLLSYADKIRAIESNTQPLGLHPSKMLQIGNDEGSFELHVDSFRLTKEGRTLLSCKHGELGSLLVSWRFFDNEIDSKTPVRTGPSYTYHSTNIYLVSINVAFLKRLQSEKLHMQLMASIGASVVPIGQTEISFAEVLLFPQNKIQLASKVTLMHSECEQTEHTHSFERYCACNGISRKSKHLGNLSLWFRLTCEIDALKTFAAKCWSLHNDSDGVTKENAHYYHKKPTKSEERMSKNANADELKQKDSAIHTKHQTDSTENTAFIYAPITTNIEPTSSLIISITIIRLKLNNVLEFMRNGKPAKQLFIEYNFLGYRRLRTTAQPSSNAELIFNFHQSFAINEKDDERNFLRLKKLLRDTERSVKLTLIDCDHERTENGESTDDCLTADSWEIGFGLLHLGKLVQNWVGNQDDATAAHQIEIPILLKAPPYHNIGCLEIAIEGIPALKRVQLSEERN